MGKVKILRPQQVQEEAKVKINSTKLTNFILDSLIYPPEEIAKLKGDPKHKLKRTILWDSEVRGLGIRVYPSGKKSFILRYSSRHRFKGERLLVLGDYPTLTLFKARKLAAEQKEQVYEGRDPVQERRRHAVDKTLFSEAALRYLNEHSIKNRSFRSDRVRINNRLVPKFGNHPIAEITFKELDGFITGIGSEHPIEANQIRGLFSRIFRRAKVWGMLDRSVPDPSEDIERYKTRKRTRVLTNGEAARLLAAADAYAAKKADYENVDIRIDRKSVV